MAEPVSVSLQCNIFCEREGELQRSARNGSGLRQDDTPEQQGGERKCDRGTVREALLF
jgi:hypothetical protein